ncbi:MAG TPA: HAMP domain-containing sensor histidine kinase [Anaeromyxobacter sp.]
MVASTPPSSRIRVAIAGTAAAAVTLRVHDDGPAIPRERVASLSDPFSASDRSRGLGLGLFITREIVAAHGGAMDVESSEGEGTTFAVTLPRVGAGDGTRTGAPAPAAGGAGGSDAPPRGSTASPRARGRWRRSMRALFGDERGRPRMRDPGSHLRLRHRRRAGRPAGVFPPLPAGCPPLPPAAKLAAE